METCDQSDEALQVAVTCCRCRMELVTRSSQEEIAAAEPHFVDAQRAAPP